MKKNNTFLMILNFLSKSEFICILIIFFINILIIGTLVQKEIGIKSVKEIYFQSFFINNNFIIFPGGKLILLLILIGLFLKIVSKSNIKTGSFIIHFGFFLFLLSSFLFIDTSEEKFLILKENEQTNIIVNNNKIILNLKYKDKIYTNEIDLLKKNYINHLIKISDKIFLKIDNYYINSNVEIENNINCKNYYNSIKNLSFVENNFDKAFLNLSLIDYKKNFIKKIFFIENVIENLSLDINGDKIFITCKKLEEKLPFFIYLNKFNKILYENSLSTKNYKSEIIIKENNLEWKYNIEMNKPLKYKKYIFFQASFIENNGYFTILFVSNNCNNFYVYTTCFFSLIGFFILLMEIFKKKGFLNEI